MPRVEIRLRIDPTTQKKTITVAYESDADALPFEHEEEHRRIVHALVQRGVLEASEADGVVVERVETLEVEAEAAQQETSQRQSVPHEE